MMPAVFAASQPELNFKIYSPQDSAPPAAQPPAGAPEQNGAAGADNNGDQATPAGTLTPKTDAQASAPANSPSDKSAADSLWSTDSTSSTAGSTKDADAASAAAGSNDAVKSGAETPSLDTSLDKTAEPAAASESSTAAAGKSEKVLKGYIRVVPSGTKIPIIMDTAVDSDTSQEGDEFAARTSEDLNIDGTTVVPAGSVIKGRIAQLNAPRSMGRSGSVALKFDTVTTPDNRQIPLVANLVARGGVVHARRGLKDIAMDSGTFALPTALGLGIGVLAGSSKSNSSGKSHLGKGTGALIGAGVGAAVGVAILAIKKGKKVDVRPGDELKIELAEDLRMPM
jgi:hypothetical protein